MATNLIKLIGIGFSSWWKNLSIIFPFLFNMIASMIIFIICFLLAFPILKISFSDLASITEENSSQFTQQIVTTLSNSSTLALLVIVIAVLMLILALISAYFTSGAIGMANDYLKLNKALSLKDMHENGKKFMLRYFFFQLIFFIILTILSVLLFSIMNLISPVDPSSSGLVGFSEILLLVVFSLVMIALLSFVVLTPYVFVIDDSNLWQAFGNAFKIACKNYLPLFILTLLFSLSFLLQMIPIAGPIISYYVITPTSQFSYLLFYKERK